MKKVYSTLEEFEKANPYVLVEAPFYQGKKCGFAQIIMSYSSKKIAENNTEGGKIMTRKKAKKFIKKWNSEYETGNYAIL